MNKDNSKKLNLRNLDQQHTVKLGVELRRLKTMKNYIINGQHLIKCNCMKKEESSQDQNLKTEVKNVQCSSDYNNIYK